MSRNILLVMIAACAAGCATVPQAPTPAATEAEHQAQAVNASAAAPLAAAVKPGIPAGFKMKSVNGETVYCTRTTTLGSRFVKEICMDDAELADFKLRNEQMRQDLRKSTGLCNGTTGYGACKGGNG